MTNSVRINASEADFFRHLAELTTAYKAQPLLVFPDGKIVARVWGRRFKLWPRGGGRWGWPGMLMPVLVGEVAEGAVRWHIRRFLLAYAWLPTVFGFCVGLSIAGILLPAGVLVVAGVLMMLFVGAICWLACRIGRRYEREMEGIVKCAARGTD